MRHVFEACGSPADRKFVIFGVWGGGGGAEIPPKGGGEAPRPREMDIEAQKGNRWEHASWRFYDQPGYDLSQIVKEIWLFMTAINRLFGSGQIKTAAESYYSYARRFVRKLRVFHVGQFRESHTIYCEDIASLEATCVKRLVEPYQGAWRTTSVLGPLLISRFPQCQ